MKVLLVDDILDVGGKERQFLTGLKALREFDIDIHVALLKGKGTLGDRAIKLANGYIICNRKHALSPVTIRKIRKYIVRNGIDLIHCNGMIDSLHMFLATRGLSVKLICTVHGYERGLYLLVHKYVLSRFDAVVAVSRSFLDDLVNLRYRCDTFVVIPNSVAPEFFEVIRHAKASTTRIVMLSRFDWFKDQLTVVKAMKHLKQSGIRAHTDLIGSGAAEYLDPVQEYVRANDLDDVVSFLGEIENVVDCIGGYDLMVMASTADTFGISLVEGMAAGLPVIASNIKPFQEILGNGKYGLLFENGNPSQLASCLISIIESQDKGRIFSQLAKERAADYLPEQYAKKMTSLYHTLMKNEVDNSAVDSGRESNE